MSLTDQIMAEPPPTTEPKRPSRGRGVIAWICLILAFLLTIPSVVAFWGHRTFLDTATYVETVGPLAADAQIQKAVAQQVSAAVTKNLDIDAIVEETVGEFIQNPRALTKIETTLESSLPALINDVTLKIMETEQFQELWVTVNRALQTVLIKVLEGDMTQVENGQLVLDTAPIIDKVKQGLVDRGIEQAANLEVPAADRQIVLMNGEELQQAQTIYRFADPLSAWLIVVPILLYLAAILISPRRRKMTVLVGAAVLINGLLLAIALALGQGAIENRFDNPALAAAADVFYTTLLDRLKWAFIILIVVGIVIAGAGIIAGRGRNKTSQELA